MSDYDLSQLDENQLLNLPEEVLLRLSVRLLNELKAARERLKQNSRNSSRPPSSDPVWKKERRTKDDSVETETTQDEALGEPESKKSASNSSQTPGKNKTKDIGELRKPGKQPGAEGFGRQQKIAITANEHHIPHDCACCQFPLKRRRKNSLYRV